MQKVEIIEGTKGRINRKTATLIERQRVAAYCRVSTDSEEQLLSYNSQVEHYTNLITENHEWAFVGIYADVYVIIDQTEKIL